MRSTDLGGMRRSRRASTRARPPIRAVSVRNCWGREDIQTDDAQEGEGRRGRNGKEALVPTMTVHPSRDMWEQRYGAEEYVFGTEPNDFLREHVGRLGAGKVLCLAEGEGRNAVFLAENGFDVSSVDLTEAGVAKTLHLADQRGVVVRAETGDLAEFDLGEAKWDAIVSIFAHVPRDLRRQLHRRVVDALVPGGIFLLEAYTPDQIGRGTGGPQVPELTMTASELRSELAPLETIFECECVRPVIEGPGHTGDGAVVQLIARNAA